MSTATARPEEGPPVRALVYRFSPPRWLAARGLGRRGPPALKVALSGVVLGTVRLPAPEDGWHTVAVRQCGICGSDVGMLTGATGPQLSPFVSFPAVPGHEVLGVAADGPFAGRRVIVDPFLGCRVRGLPLCPPCAGGRTAVCERFAEGSLPPGMLLGFCRGLPGGWSERIRVHLSQIHPVPDAVGDDAAVLAEPLAVALHAVLPRAPERHERVLVLGAGTIGLCVVAALRLLAADAEITVVARRPAQAAMARRLGAAEVLSGSAEAEALAQRQGWGQGFRGLLGVRGWTGGFDQVFDAVGSPGTLAAALRLTRSGGRVALVGSSGVLPRLDLTPLWAHELEVAGFCGYGSEPAALGEHTLDLALRLLAERPDVPLAELVTHRFPLERYRDALAACFFHARSGAIKVLFAPGAPAGGEGAAPR